MTVTTTRSPNRSRRGRRKGRTVVLTAAYVPSSEGGYTVEVLDAVGVHSQGDTFDEARKNLHEVVALMLEEAPRQFGSRRRSPPPGALLETLFVVLPA
jgi:predicted RNase H-like HicB family nuclease